MECKCPKCGDVHRNFKEMVNQLSQMIMAARKLEIPNDVRSILHEDLSRPRNCHTGQHTYHTYVPWMYQKPYDGQCNVCGHQAAWCTNENKPKEMRVYLCDCCAQDWSEWNDKHQGLKGAGRDLKDAWAREFRLFSAYQQEASSAPGGG